MISYKEFYTRFGLKENPFASFTTENEGNRFSKTFIKPNDYETILENFSQKNSIILTGDRGTGKTALIKDFINKFSSPSSLIVQVVDFSQLKTDYELQDFYKFVISSISVELFLNISSKKNPLSKLSKEEKFLLCYLLKYFVPQISKRQLREKIEKIQLPFHIKIYKRFGNIFRGLLNYGAAAGESMIDNYIAKHFTGLPPISESAKIKDYFPELPINLEEEFIDQNSAYQLLLRIISIAKHLGFDRILIVFDRIDEDARFMNDAESISEFIVKILTDNKFFLDENLQVVFTTWITPFNFIKDQVRTQKHYCPNLVWTKDDLIKALNQRLLAYSDDCVTDYNLLFESTVTDSEINEIFKIANSNPRDLWHIFNSVFKSQFDINPNLSKIQSETIPIALTQFVTTFNYYEYYPKKSNARANSMDIYSYAKHLLKLDSEIFTKNQLNDKAQTGGSTNNYVVSMEKIGLIGIDSQQGGIVNYKIKDQKVIYALKNGLEIKRD